MLAFSQWGCLDQMSFHPLNQMWQLHDLFDFLTSPELGDQEVGSFG